MNVRRNFNIPASLLLKAQAVVDAIGNGHQGMLRASMTAGEGVAESLGHISSGWIDDTSPLLAGKTAVIAAIDGAVPEADISDVMDALDITDVEQKDPRQRIAELEAEADATVSAIDWVQPTGSEDAIELGAFRKHNGKTWVSLQAANVFEPGVASWREVWSTATDTPPAWVQPLGATDAYRTGERVTHNGTTWHTLNDFNVFEPGTLNAGWIDENASTGDEWAEGVAYKLNDEVTFEGVTYRCIQPHTSISVWTPPATPALWEEVT